MAFSAAIAYENPGVNWNIQAPAFSSIEEAEDYALSIVDRSSLVADYKAVERTVPITHAYTGKLVYRGGNERLSETKWVA